MSMETDHENALEILRIKAELAAARAASAEYIARTDPVLDGKEKLEDDLAAAQASERLKTDCLASTTEHRDRLHAELAAAQKERKEVVDALNEAAAFGHFDGYDEDTPLLRNIVSYFDRLARMAQDQEKKLQAELAAVEGICAKALNDAFNAEAELAAARGERDRLDGELGFGVAALAICQRDLAAAREALKRALPVLEEYAEDESVFWGGASHYIAKDAIEVFEQARAALDAAKEDEP